VPAAHVMAVWGELDKLGEPWSSGAGSKAAAVPVPLCFRCRQACGIKAHTGSNT